MIYLASPYSNDPDGNYQAMLDYAARILQRAPPPLIFSPVTFFHPIAQKLQYEEVMELCLAMLKKADQLIVVALAWMA
jgi:hypothetical protein